VCSGAARLGTWFSSRRSEDPARGSSPGGRPPQTHTTPGLRRKVAARNPEVIILADLTRGEPGDTAQEKIDLLKNDPLTSKLNAVANDRFVIIPGRYMDPSYDSAYAVPALAEGLVGLQ
jgi:ABC-type Fe3+-hydroxamate transport system substrate-binding protein